MYRGSPMGTGGALLSERPAVYLPLALSRSDPSPLRAAQTWVWWRAFTDFSLKRCCGAADVCGMSIRRTTSLLLLTALLAGSLAGPAMATENSTYRHRLYLAIN